MVIMVKYSITGVLFCVRVPVTPWNVEELREMVRNGPDVHPGAIAIETENGQRKFLDPKKITQREALAKTLLTSSGTTSGGSNGVSSNGVGGGSGGNRGSSDLGGATKYVYRHLINGDPMLLNRQPTLHKPSIMSHK